MTPFLDHFLRGNSIGKDSNTYIQMELIRLSTAKKTSKDSAYETRENLSSLHIIIIIRIFKKLKIFNIKNKEHSQ